MKIKKILLIETGYNKIYNDNVIISETCSGMKVYVKYFGLKKYRSLTGQA